jgi:hypothetical protein
MSDEHLSVPSEFTCPTCGYRWQKGQHGGHRCETLMQEKINRLESLMSFALTVESINTDEWMSSFCDAINRHLASEADHRRCTFDGRELRLRSIRNASKHVIDMEKERQAMKVAKAAGLVRGEAEEARERVKSGGSLSH